MFAYKIVFALSFALLALVVQRSYGFQTVPRVFHRSLQRHQTSLFSQHKVILEHEGKQHTLSVGEDVSILDAALDEGIDLPYSCRAGSCSTCAGKIISGEVDQSEGSLDEDVMKKGYCLLCITKPLSEVHATTVDEEEFNNA